MFTKFLQHDYDGLNSRVRATFEQLLNVQDPVIMDWLFGYARPPDDDLAGLLGKIRRSTEITRDQPD